MRTLTRKEFEDMKKKVEPIRKLAMHDDADGISSAVLLSYIFKIEKVWCPKDFGEWSLTPSTNEDGSLELVPDFCVDMVPANPKWSYTCIDHHNHPPKEQRSYDLIWGEVPTGLMIYDLFKAQLPEEQKWKCVVSAVGDVATEMIPPEIWRNNPSLLEETVSTYERYGKLETSRFPVYLRLTSGLNALCKMPDKWAIAYQTLRNAKTPIDLINDITLKNARQYLADEKARLYREFSPLQLRNGITFFDFQSKTKLERTLAWELWEKDLKTVIAINNTTKRGSIRGVLATLVYEHLSSKGFKCSGHPGAGGIKLKPDQDSRDVYKALIELRI